MLLFCIYPHSHSCAFCVKGLQLARMKWVILLHLQNVQFIHCLGTYSVCVVRNALCMTNWIVMKSCFFVRVMKY